jgi:hypothetical protein
MFREFEADKESWNNPAPNRTGFILPVALVMKLLQRQDMTVPVGVSVFSSILAFLLTVWLAQRHFSDGAALATALFMTVSLVELGLARRAWQDETFGLYCLMLFAVAAEITRTPARKSLYVAFHGMAALCLLTKQPALVSYGLCSAALLFVTRRYLAMIIGWPLAVLGALGVWSVLGGGPALALAVFRDSLTAGASAWQYQQECCSGPWWQLSYVLWLINPVTSALALAGVYAVRRNRVGLVALTTTVGFLAFISFYPKLQSLRFVSPVHAIYCLLAGAGAVWLVDVSAPRLPRSSVPALYALVAGIAVAAMTREYRVFRVVADSAMQDLGAVPVREMLSR